MLDRETQRHRAPHGVADHDGAAEIERVQHGGDVVDEPVEAEGRGHRRRAAEPAVVHGDHAPATFRQTRGQGREDPEVGAVAVEQHHRPPGAGLLEVDAGAVGCGDGVGALGREGERVVEVGVGRGVEPGQDTSLVDHRGGDEGTGEPQRHEIPPAAHVAAGSWSSR